MGNSAHALQLLLYIIALYFTLNYNWKLSFKVSQNIFLRVKLTVCWLLLRVKWKMVSKIKHSPPMQMQIWRCTAFGVYQNCIWVVKADFCWPVSRAGFSRTVWNLKPRYQLNSNSATKTAAAHLPKRNFLLHLRFKEYRRSRYEKRHNALLIHHCYSPCNHPAVAPFHSNSLPIQSLNSTQKQFNSILNSFVRIKFSIWTANSHMILGEDLE